MADINITQDANLTNNTAPVLADRMVFIRNSDSAFHDITPDQLMKIINLLTADTVPQIGDKVVTYDVSASLAKSVTLQYLLSFLPDGTMLNGKLSVTVSSNDLVVALKTQAGNDPSANDPVLVKINGTWRSATAATSMTLADATNWFNAGGAELATKEIDYFAYAVWDSNSSLVAVSAARRSDGRLVSDFSATTTSANHLGNYANFTSTDDVCVIGRFAATLSAGAGYTWTVPTFTNANLIQHPIFETRWLDWAPTPTGFSAVPTTLANRYRIEKGTCTVISRAVTPGTSNATTYTIPLPFVAKTVTNMVWQATGTGRDNSVDLTVAIRVAVSSAASVMDVFTNYLSGTWTGSNTKILYQMTPLTYEI
jgi:hypothetical protein